MDRYNRKCTENVLTSDGIILKTRSNCTSQMPDGGPRQRGKATSVDGDDEPDSGKRPESSGVTLKKEIGLVSACGIIVGKFLSSSLATVTWHAARWDHLIWLPWQRHVSHKKSIPPELHLPAALTTALYCKTWHLTLQDLVVLHSQSWNETCTYGPKFETRTWKIKHTEGFLLFSAVTWTLLDVPQGQH